MAFIEPLNLQQVIINNLAGSVEIFVFLAMIGISVAAARLQFSRSVYLVMWVLFGILFSNFIGGLYLIIVLVLSFIVFTQLAKMFR
jgi:hypothetical protein